MTKNVVKATLSLELVVSSDHIKEDPLQRLKVEWLSIRKTATESGRFESVQQKHLGVAFLGI